MCLFLSVFFHVFLYFAFVQNKLLKSLPPPHTPCPPTPPPHSAPRQRWSSLRNTAENPVALGARLAVSETVRNFHIKRTRVALSVALTDSGRVGRRDGAVSIHFQQRPGELLSPQDCRLQLMLCLASRWQRLKRRLGPGLIKRCPRHCYAHPGHLQ